VAAPVSKFRRLSITHAAMMGADAAMVVALADSLFFSIEPDAARTRVLLFLVVSFAPFLVVAPIVGPIVDRAAGGRRAIIQLVAIARVVLCLLMARFVDNLALFPLVFASLVLQKAYLVSKSALVPSVVRTDAELVEANSKLGVIAGLTGFVAVIPAALMQAAVGAPVTMVYAALVFGFALASATRLPADVVADHEPEAAERIQLHSTGLQLAAAAMMILRGAVGFMFFLLAFWLRDQGGTALFGVALGLAALGTMAGNALAPRLRRAGREEVMLTGALAVTTVAGFVAALLGGVVAGIVLVTVLNFSAAVGRLAFDSIVQRDAPGANRGRAFARFETRFQLSWAVAGLIPVMISIPGPLGFLLVGVMAGAALFNYIAGSRSGQPTRRLTVVKRVVRRSQP
jgi:hypothetical protein